MVKSTLSKAAALAVLGASTAAAECTFKWPASSGDTCASMASLWGITLAQFQTYNPTASCSTGLVVGTDYCVEWDLGQAPPVTTTTSSTTAKITTSSSKSSSTLITVTTTTSAGTTGPTPVQDGIAANCNKYYQVVSGDYCQKIADANGISLANFYSWNPAVGSSCGGLWTGYYVCVGAPGTTPVTSTKTTAAPSGPTPVQDGIASNCNKFYQVVSGDYCQKIVDANGISLANFYSWNPAVGSSCGGLWTGYYVCVGVPGSSNTPAPPSPVQAGIPSTCKKYYQAVSGDYCQKIADANKISLANFYSWNPAVGTSCGSLWVGYYYCVSN